MSILERVAIVVASLLLSVGLIALLSGFFAARDQPGVASAAGPGRHYRDLGDALLAPGELRPAYDSEPPTSGAHLPAPVTRDFAQLSDDQILEALSLGNVIFGYGERTPPPALVSLAAAVAGNFTPALARAGQAVILARMPGRGGIVGLAWTHMIRAASPGDPRLRAFAVYWLGRGANARP